MSQGQQLTRTVPWTRGLGQRSAADQNSPRCRHLRLAHSEESKDEFQPKPRPDAECLLLLRLLAFLVDHAPQDDDGVCEEAWWATIKLPHKGPRRDATCRSRAKAHLQ